MADAVLDAIEEVDISDLSDDDEGGKVVYAILDLQGRVRKLEHHAIDAFDQRQRFGNDRSGGGRSLRRPDDQDFARISAKGGSMLQPRSVAAQEQIEKSKGKARSGPEPSAPPGPDQPAQPEPHEPAQPEPDQSAQPEPEPRSNPHHTPTPHRHGVPLTGPYYLVHFDALNGVENLQLSSHGRGTIGPSSLDPPVNDQNRPQFQRIDEHGNIYVVRENAQSQNTSNRERAADRDSQRNETSFQQGQEQNDSNGAEQTQVGLVDGTRLGNQDLQAVDPNNPEALDGSVQNHVTKANQSENVASADQASNATVTQPPHQPSIPPGSQGPGSTSQGAGGSTRRGTKPSFSYEPINNNTTIGGRDKVSSSHETLQRMRERKPRATSVEAGGGTNADQQKGRKRNRSVPQDDAPENASKKRKTAAAESSDPKPTPKLKNRQSSKAGKQAVSAASASSEPPILEERQSNNPRSESDDEDIPTLKSRGK